MIETIEFNKISLLERIKSAESNEKLGTLNTEGNGYVFASDKTRRRWKSATICRSITLKRNLKESEGKNK